jgi:hypothetical protein
MIVYSNSCSFGALQSHTIYPEVVAKAFSLNLVNKGTSGSCNRRIIRTSLRDLNKLKSKDNVLLLLGLTFISRTEIWRPNINPNQNDGHFHPIKVNNHQINWAASGLIDTIVSNIHDYTDSEIKDYYREWLLHYNPEAEVTNLLTDLIMLTGWCKNNNIRYVIFSNVDCLPGNDKVGYNSEFIQSLKETIDQDKNIIDPWTFSFGGYALAAGFEPKDKLIYGKHGHPGKQAHIMFGNYLVDHIKKNYNL